MEYRLLGRAGVQVSPLALGTGNFLDPTPEDECEPILNAAIDAGINLIGTGNTYPGEPVIGRILKANGRRHDVLISTMVDHATGPAQLGPNERDLSRHNIIRACERSLKNLQTDYIDLYLLHRPTTLDIPIDESLGALDDLVLFRERCATSVAPPFRRGWSWKRSW